MLSRLRSIAWRDTFSVWPFFQIRIVLSPWNWYLRWHWDVYWHGSDGGSFDVQFGPLAIQGGWNKGWFPLEYRCTCPHSVTVHDTECPQISGYRGI